LEIAAPGDSPAGPGVDGPPEAGVYLAPMNSGIGMHHHHHHHACRGRGTECIRG
jgi:hypothetical protein